MNTDTAMTGTPLDHTAQWYWFLYEAGLSTRRAKQCLLSLLSRPTQAPHQPGGRLIDLDSLRSSLNPEERAIVMTNEPGLSGVVAKLEAWRQEGTGILRCNETYYPTTLHRHQGEEQRPLLLSYRGDITLLDLPLIMPVGDDDLPEEVMDWTGETFLALAAEGALPLIPGRGGFEADLVRYLLRHEAPLALILTAGLAHYHPPAMLAAAIEEGRALILSPFRPDWDPGANPDERTLQRTLTLAQAMADVLFILSDAYSGGLLPSQPAFLRPGLTHSLPGAIRYEDPEALMQQVVERSVAIETRRDDPAPLKPPSQPGGEAPGIDPEDLIQQLSQLGHVPDTMKARLRSGRPSDAVN